MRKSGIVAALLVVAILLVACGTSSSITQVSSSTILVTKFNGQLNVTGIKRSSVVNLDSAVQHFNAVSFISKTEIVATTPAPNTSTMLKSFDEGRSWNKISVIPGTASQLEFPSPQIGFAVSRSGVNSSSDSLYSTTNGGQTWTSVYQGGVAIEAVGFLTAHSGYSVMRSLSSSGQGSTAFIYRTTDGGQTWEKVQSPLSPSVISASFSFVSSARGWLLAGSPTGAGTQVKYLYSTADGGKTWSLAAQTQAATSSSSPQGNSLPALGLVNELQFISASTGFMQLSQGGFLETQDSGKTWQNIRLSGLPIQSEKSVIQFSAWGTSSFSVATSRASFWLTTAPNQWIRVYPPYRDAEIFSGQSGLFALSDSGALSTVETSAFQQLVTYVPQGTIQIDPFGTGIIALTPSKIFISTGGSHWGQMPIPQGWSLLQGHFLTSDFGVVVANVRGTPGSAVLALTNDAGSSWQTIHTKFYPYSIDPVNATSWWALGGTAVTNAASQGKLVGKNMIWNLYYTGDGGRSWDEFIANWHDVGGLDFVSTSEGYVWTPGKLYRTVDRGSSFTSIDLPSQLGIEGIFSMSFEPGGVGWSLGSGGYPIFHTIDSGVHWGSNP